MTRDCALTLPSSIPEIALGNEGQVLAFLHANAYPPECYRPLLSAFAMDFRVRAMLQRPLWEDFAVSQMDSWHCLSLDLLAWLRRSIADPIVAVGHSLGAIVALRACLQDPARFRALVLIDPVLLTKARILLWRVLRRLPTGQRMLATIRRAERRRRVFKDMDEVFEAYRRHPIFRQMTDQRLRDVIQGLMEPVDDHLQLRYNPAWEAHIYRTALWKDADLWSGLPSLKVPMLIIRGSESDTLTAEACNGAQKANRLIQIATVEGSTHLVPLERPADVHALAREFIERALGSTEHMPAPEAL